MDALPLDPDGYGGTYKLVAGRIALDLVNTISWPRAPKHHDWIQLPGNAIAWATAVGLLRSAEGAELAKAFEDDPALASREVQSLGALRAALDAVLRPLCMQSKPKSSAVEELNLRLAACLPPIVDTEDLNWVRRPIECLSDIQTSLVQDAADIITGSDHQRLGHCPSCEWLFIDTARNRSRKWCDMADCGSRDKSRRYYHRQKQ